jgi:hypothetical protein
VTCCGAATHIVLQLAPDLLIFLKEQASKVIEFRSSQLSRQTLFVGCFAFDLECHSAIDS